MSSVTLLSIPEQAGVDSIRVYWHNLEPGKGYVTLTCWGCAWNSYFGGMNGQTIEQFFAGADTSYLVSKLGNTQWLKATKKHEVYLARLINAVKAALTVQEAVHAAD